MSAFDDIAREDIGPANGLIGLFDYLNVSARPEAALVRTMTDEMLARFPEAHRPALTQRLRSRNDGLHRGAAFELIVHELLLRQSFEIVSVEPTAPNGRSPDFLAKDQQGNLTYVECTVALGPAGADPGADRRLREALQAIDEVNSPDFFLNVSHEGMPATPVRLNHLKRSVQQFVDGLRYEEAVQTLQQGRALPQTEFRHDGLALSVSAIPKHTRGGTGRAIGGRWLAGGRVTPHEAIRSSIIAKAGHYGELDHPFVIAICAMETFADESSALDALFGTPAAVGDRNGVFRMTRNSDGVWRGPQGPQHTRVSAVLSTERLSLWDLGQRSARLIFNPSASRPLASDPWTTPKVAYAEPHVSRTEGSAIGALLALPDRWPEIETPAANEERRLEQSGGKAQ